MADGDTKAGRAPAADAKFGRGYLFDIWYFAALSVDLKPGKVPGARGNELQKRLFWNGLHIKWTGDTAIIAPPLVAEKAHIDELIEKLRKTIVEFKD